MNNIKEKLIGECVDIIRRDDVKKEIKKLFSPIITMILKDIYPYIYISMLFVIISFLLVLGIFVLMLKYYNLIIKKL